MKFQISVNFVLQIKKMIASSDPYNINSVTCSRRSQIMWIYLVLQDIQIKKKIVINRIIWQLRHSYFLTSDAKLLGISIFLEIELNYSRYEIDYDYIIHIYRMYRAVQIRWDYVVSQKVQLQTKLFAHSTAFIGPTRWLNQFWPSIFSLLY